MNDEPRAREMLPVDPIDLEAAKLAERVIVQARIASGVARIFGRIGREALEEGGALARVYLHAAAKGALSQIAPDVPKVAEAVVEAVAEKGLVDVRRFARAAALAAADVATAEVGRLVREVGAAPRPHADTAPSAGTSATG